MNPSLTLRVTNSHGELGKMAAILVSETSYVTIAKTHE
jgi:hypothetical protein